MSHLARPCVVVLAVCLAMLSTADHAAASSLPGIFDTSHFVGYVDTESSVNLANLAASKTNGVNHGSYATWTGNINTSHERTSTYNSALTYAMTNDGKMFVGIENSDVQKSLVAGMLSDTFYWYPRAQSNHADTMIQRDYLAREYRSLTDNGIASSGRAFDDLVDAESGVLNNVGQSVFGVYNGYFSRGTVNESRSTWDARIYVDAAEHWGPGYAWTGTIEREYNLQYTNATGSVIHTVGATDNGGWTRTYTDGIQRTASDNWQSNYAEYDVTGALPDDFKLRMKMIWSSGWAHFSMAVMADDVTSSHLSGSVAQTAIYEMQTGWNGTTPEGFESSAVPGPLAAFAVVPLFGAMMMRRQRRAFA